jgi:hypothetical protein
MLPGAWTNSVTAVELAQLPAGLAAWQSHSLGIYRACGPVSKWLYSLGPFLAGSRVSYPDNYNSSIFERYEWEIGKDFQIQSKEYYIKIYRLSRLAPILLTMFCGAVICRWSSRLFGAWQGVASLAVWCWMAPVLAHGALVTSDMASAVMTLLAARAFWGFVTRPSASAMLASGMALGFAQATKYTSLILDPCWLVLLICRVLQLRRSRTAECPGMAPGARPLSQQASPSTARFLMLGLGIFAASVAAIDLSYGFRGVGLPLSEWHSGRSSLARDVQWLEKSPVFAPLLRVPMPLPIEFFRGLDVQLADTERLQAAYLLGQMRSGGWWYWYAAAALIKLPIPALILFSMAVARLPAAMRGGNDLIWSSICLLVPAVEIFLVISATTGTGTNAAFRYLLPSLALLSVWSGCAWNGLARTGRRCLAILPGWLFASAILATPDHIGWQNELGWVAGRCVGKPPLVGDSLDWGQDLLRLEHWIAEHSAQGSTAACVYSLGNGEPFGLHEPAARATLSGATFLAISENILFGYDSHKTISINDRNIFLSPEQIDYLRIVDCPFRVGRTVRIYRLPDLPARLFTTAGM